MQKIELNEFVTVCESGISDVLNFEHDVESAQEMYKDKRKLVDDVFANIGAEHYQEISAILYKKCFGQIDDKEETSKHIMYRALMGTIIDRVYDKGEFIYDKYDKTLETILSYIVYADSLDRAIGIIDAIDVDLDIKSEQSIN